jgi:proline dehydrogenase
MSADLLITDEARYRAGGPEPDVRVGPDAAVDLDEEICELGRRLSGGSTASGWSSRGAQDRAMTLVGRNPHLRAALFRLVDVAPACHGPAELAEHLAAFLDAVP